MCVCADTYARSNRGNLTQGSCGAAGAPSLPRVVRVRVGALGKALSLGLLSPPHSTEVHGHTPCGRVSLVDTAPTLHVALGVCVAKLMEPRKTCTLLGFRCTDVGLLAPPSGRVSSAVMSGPWCVSGSVCAGSCAPSARLQTAVEHDALRVSWPRVLQWAYTTSGSAHSC